MKHTATIYYSHDRHKIYDARDRIVEYLCSDRRVTSIAEANTRDLYAGSEPEMILSFIVGPEGLDSDGPVPAINLDTLCKLAAALGVSCSQVVFE